MKRRRVTMLGIAAAMMAAGAFGTYQLVQTKQADNQAEPAAAHDATASIAGRYVDASSASWWRPDRPIAGAPVALFDEIPLSDGTFLLAGTSFTTTTDANGEFSLTGVPAGTWVLQVAGRIRMDITLTAGAFSNLGDLHMPHPTEFKCGVGVPPR